MVLVSVLLSCYLRRGWFIVCYFFFHYLLCNGQRKKEATGYFEKKWKLLFSGYLVMLWSVIPSTVLMIAWYSLVSVSVWFSCKLSVVCLMKLQWQCVWWSCNMSVLTEHLFRVSFMCCVYGDLWTDTAHLLLALGSGLVSSQNGFSATNRSEYFQGSGFNYTNNSRIATVQVHPRWAVHVSDNLPEYIGIFSFVELFSSSCSSRDYYGLQTPSTSPTEFRKIQPNPHGPRRRSGVLHQHGPT